MKKITVLFVLAALLALVGSCSLDDKDSPTQSIPDPDPNPNPNPSGNPLTLKVGQTGTVAPIGMRITFDTVLLDSRCPDSARCYRGGMALIRLEVGGHGARPQGVVFHIDPDEHDPDSTRYVVTPFGRYRIDLRTLDPYPTIDDPRPYEEYSVTLSVRPFYAADDVVGEVVPSVLPLPTLRGNGIDIDSAWIFGNLLLVAVTYSGDCEQHQLTMFMSPPVFAESYPAQANLYLYHNGNGDACRAVVHEHLTFSLKPVVDLYWEMYGQDDPFWLNVHDLPRERWRWREVERVLYWPPDQDCVRIVPDVDQLLPEVN